MSEKKKDTCGCGAEHADTKISRPSYYGAKRAITGEVVAEVRAKGRRLSLSENWSRSVKVGEIHEIMLTDDALSPGDVMSEFMAVAFFETSQGGHSVIGDRLYLDGVEVGVLAGYEMNHMPNHMNIVFMSSGDYPEFKLGSQIRIQ